MHLPTDDRLRKIVDMIVDYPVDRSGFVTMFRKVLSISLARYMTELRV